MTNLCVQVQNLIEYSFMMYNMHNLAQSQSYVSFVSIHSNNFAMKI